MSNKNITYISKVITSLFKQNEDVITIQTETLSPEGDTFIVDNRVLTVSALVTTSSLNELTPEISETFPYKIVTPKLSNGHTLILSPNTAVFPTASQNYYMATKFDRYNPTVIRSIDREFQELRLET